MLMVIGTGCIDSCKYNCHTVPTPHYVINFVSDLRQVSKSFEYFLLAIVLSVLRVIFIANCIGCPSGYFYCQLYWLSFELFLFDHCIVCPSSYFCLAIVLSVLRIIFIANCTVCSSNYFYCQLYCLSFELFLLPIALSVLRVIFITNCIVCPSNYFYCQLYCLSFELF
jgi:hypothetical protein